MAKRRPQSKTAEEPRSASVGKTAQARLKQALGTPDIADDAISLSLQSLSEEDREKLSKVLFPDTHTDTVTVLGQERKLRPTPLKVSRQLFTLLKDVAEITSGAMLESPEMADEETSFAALELDFDTVVVKNLVDVIRVLADFYGEAWKDIREALSQEELSLAEMQTIVFVQQQLNTANDFFLQPLRSFIKLLQMREIAMLLMEKFVSTSITLPS